MGYLGLTPTTAQQNYLNIDDISGSFNGTTTSFALQVGSVAPTPFPVTNSCLISVGGVIQEPDDTGTSGFRISGGNIVFSSAPGTGEDFFGLILAGADYLNIGANFPDGTVGTPSITFDSDTNTGIYHPSADELSFVTGGSDRVRVDSNGRLGIGTSSPSYPLDVIGDGGITSSASTNSTSGLISVVGKNSSGSVSAIGRIRSYPDGSGNTSQLAFETRNSSSTMVEAMRIDSSQRVGIGTNSPSNALHISTSDNTPLKVQSSASNSYINFVNSNNGQGYIGYEVQDMNFYTANNERMRIDGSGQLLINSTTSRTNVNSLEPRVQIEGNNNDTSTLAIISNSTADGTAAQLHFCKSSNGTIGNNGAVVANELLGRIAFDGNDGTNFETGAAILSTMQSNASSGNVSAKLRFYTRGDGSSIREAVQINAGGFTKLKGNHDGFISENGDSHEVLTNRSNDDCLINKTFNGGYTATNYMALAARSATSAYAFMYCVSGHTGSTDNEFRLMGDGNAYADGSWNGGGADYAEMFEWSDGNADAEDRRGLSVVLDGDKIREAVVGEEPIGVISGNPSVVGDAAWNKWSQKHLTDDYGSYVSEDHNVVEWTDELGDFHSYEDWSLPEGVVVPDYAVTKTHDDKGNKLQHRAVNPVYDPDVTYVSRAERKEWDAVGLMGKLRIRKGQVTGARWIKMRDISDNVEEWLVR